VVVVVDVDVSVDGIGNVVGFSTASAELARDSLAIDSVHDADAVNDHAHDHDYELICQHVSSQATRAPYFRGTNTETSTLPTGATTLARFCTFASHPDVHFGPI